MADSISSSSAKHAAASICCDEYEKHIVSSLVRSHKRPDNKLTPTERTRLIFAFFHAWRLLLDNPETEPTDGIQEKMMSMKMKHIVLVREVAAFMFCNVEDAQLREMARLMGAGDRWDREQFTPIVIAAAHCLEKKKGWNWSCMPDFAPLGLWAMFDHWQKDYMVEYEEPFEEGQRQNVDQDFETS
jgi:hypothetical protein